MSKRLSRITSIFSISLLLTAMSITVSASPTATADAPEAPTSVEAKEYTPLSAKKAEAFALAPREYRAAISKDAYDRHGYEKSLYRGKYYYSDQENFRMCVMYRESRYGYTSTNSSSSASGAYQFLDSQWRDGLVYMMLRESKKYDHNLEDRLRTLFDKPINKWNRYFQDRAFFTALNYESKWSGRHHWNATVPGTSCNNVPSTTVKSASYKSKDVSDEYKRAHSKAAKDMEGYEKSLYRGKYYDASQESWRQCVMWRESNYRYNLIGAGYNWPYHGAYQFHNVNWKRGLIIMMAKESKETKDGLNGPARKLKDKNINEWNRYWQDRALFTVLNYNGKWSGAHHWNMTRGGC